MNTSVGIYIWASAKLHRVASGWWGMVTNHHDSLLQSPSYTARGFVETVNWNLKGALQRSQSYAATIHPRSPNPPELWITEVVLQTARWQEMKDWYSAFLGVEPFFETETMCFRRVSHAHNQLFVLFHFPDLQERPVAAYRAYVQSDAFRRNPCGIAIDQDEWEASCARMLAAGFRRVPSYNPYWDVHGRTFEDLDGYRVVLQNTVWTM